MKNLLLISILFSNILIHHVFSIEFPYSEFFNAQKSKEQLSVITNNNDKYLVFDIFSMQNDVQFIESQTNAQSTYFSINFKQNNFILTKELPNSISSDKPSSKKNTTELILTDNGFDFEEKTSQIILIDSNQTEFTVKNIEYDNNYIESQSNSFFSGQFGLGIINKTNIFLQNLKSEGIIDNMVVFIGISNQFLNHRSQLVIGGINKNLVKNESTVKWQNNVQDQWVFQSELIKINEYETRNVKLMFDFNHENVVLPDEIYDNFLRILQNVGFVCRAKSKYLECFSSKILKTPLFPSFEISIGEESILFKSEYLILDSNPETAEGVFQMNVERGKDDFVILGKKFFFQFSIILDFEKTKIGFYDNGGISLRFHRQYLMQLYLNRIVLLVLMALILSQFITKAIKLHENGADGVDFFAFQIFD